MLKIILLLDNLLDLNILGLWVTISSLRLARVRVDHDFYFYRCRVHYDYVLFNFLETEQLFNDAIKEGKVSVNITNFLIQGEVGVGKASTKCILKPPPLVRTSTPLAEAPVQFHV